MDTDTSQIGYGQFDCTRLWGFKLLVTSCGLGAGSVWLSFRARQQIKYRHSDGNAVFNLVEDDGMLRISGVAA